MRNFLVQEEAVKLNVSTYLYKVGSEPTPDLIAIENFISTRLIVGFKQGETIDCYTYVNHFITSNEHERLLKFLKDNPEVEFYYFIDEETTKLKYHLTNTVLKKDPLCFPRH